MAILSGVILKRRSCDENCAYNHHNHWKTRM